MTDQSSILGRLRAATGADRELDAAVLRAAGEQVTDDPFSRFVWRQKAPGGWFDVPMVTASLDTALALVERVLPGWLRTVGEIGGGRWESSVENIIDGVERYAIAPTAPLAVLTALFTALETAPAKEHA